MAFRLPPLSTLRIFEAAGRLLSFREAAEQLHVTPSAISHGIQLLEDWLGVALFVRGSRGLTLTEAGNAYYPYVSEALSLLVRGTDGIPGRAPRNALSISSAPTFAHSWLIPRLDDFRARHPDISIVIDTEHRHVEFPLDGVDLAIRMGREPWPDLYSAPALLPDPVPGLQPGVSAPTASPFDHGEPGGHGVAPGHYGE
jgi:DNA-binding transcriptional LysR family regulator